MYIGPQYLGKNQCKFIVWAPLLERVTLKIVAPAVQLAEMEKDETGYWHVTLDNIPPGTQYLYQLNKDVARPDPASNFQPDGIHNPSQVIDHNKFKWNNSMWGGIPLEEMIIYELHIGTFSEEGTFEAVIPRLDDLIELGITAIEIMPVAQFPGERNWGYDGVHPFAPQNSYGGPEGLKKLVNQCHQKGLAVILDVVYNHLGPEGNYLRDFAPYFTNKYQSPWGEAVNFDDAYSDGVKNYFIQNALYWFENYHMDALRLDAIHAIFDFSAKPFLQELAVKVDELSNLKKRKFYLIAESDLNDARIITPRSSGGYGIDAQWSDDFHHSVHTLLVGEKSGYYADFGQPGQLAKAMKEGFVYSGDYSNYRKRSHGNSAANRPAQQFVVCIQNHDQVGNRMLGERLSELVSFEALKLAAGTLLLSPYIPLLFMGEAYGETSPFLYFVSHGNPDLIEAVREGRKSEFKSFQWKGEPPDPQSVKTFNKCKLKWETRTEGNHQVLLRFYHKLIQLRKVTPALSKLDRQNFKIENLEKDKVLIFRRWYEKNELLCILNFNTTPILLPIKFVGTRWHRLVDSAETIWNGIGTSSPTFWENKTPITIQPLSLILYEKD